MCLLYPTKMNAPFYGLHEQDLLQQDTNYAMTDL